MEHQLQRVSNNIEASPVCLTIDRGILTEIIEHLTAGLPNESCGLLAVSPTHEPVLVASTFFAGTNIDDSPVRFTMDPAEVLSAFKKMRENDLELGAIVHSHPSSPASPSETDLAEAYYPEALLMIVSFAAEKPEIRVWRLADVAEERRAEEIPLQVT